MFGIFKKKTRKEKILEQYKLLLNEAYILSKTNRIESDLKTAEAERLIQTLDNN